MRSYSSYCIDLTTGSYSWIPDSDHRMAAQTWHTHTFASDSEPSAPSTTSPKQMTNQSIPLQRRDDRGQWPHDAIRNVRLLCS